LGLTPSLRTSLISSWLHFLRYQSLLKTLGASRPHLALGEICGLNSSLRMRKAIPPHAPSAWTKAGNFSNKKIAPPLRLTFTHYFNIIGNMKIREAVSALAALAQETRLSIYRILVQAGPEGVSAGRIGEELEVAPATLSFHLKELSHAGLVSSRQEGRFIYYSANFERMAAIMTFLTHNCCQGMPQECLTVNDTQVASCCVPNSQVKPKS